MDEFRLWLNEEIVQKRLEHAAFLKVPQTYTAMLRVNELQDEIADLRTALTKYLKFLRLTEKRDAKST